jgi:hypothetical protein
MVNEMSNQWDADNKDPGPRGVASILSLPVILGVVLSVLSVCFLSFMIYWENVNKPAIRIVNDAKLMIQKEQLLSDSTVQYLKKQFESTGHGSIEISSTTEKKINGEFIKVHLLVPAPSSMPAIFHPLWTNNRSFQTVGVGKID